jgi:hypothetical protein
MNIQTMLRLEVTRAVKTRGPVSLRRLDYELGTAHAIPSLY